MSTFFNNDYFQVDESLTFSDSQPHVKLCQTKMSYMIPTVYCRISSAQDLLKLGLLKNIYDANKQKVNVNIAYLLGGRMDRSINPYYEPFTLKVVANFINSLNFEKVNIFCPHSGVSLDLINRAHKLAFQEAVFYDKAIIHSLMNIPEFKDLASGNDGASNLRMLDTFSIVYPDKGASDRMLDNPFSLWYKNTPRVILEKKRELATGKILGMQIVSGEVKKTCVIIDDLCDGGATFKGAAQCLRESGAEKVILIVCHGIFSKGLPIEGIDYVCTTNSYKEWKSSENLFVHNLF